MKEAKDEYPAVGARVGAVCEATDDEVRLFGYGVFIGLEIPPAEVKGFLADVCRENKSPNACIKLDDGKKVYGCECYWALEDDVRAWIANRRTAIVDVDDERKKV